MGFGGDTNIYTLQLRKGWFSDLRILATYSSVEPQYGANNECAGPGIARSLGLPTTPGTVRYLLSQIAGQPFGAAPAGPTLGVILTSIGLGEYADFGNHFSGQAEIRERRGDMAFQISGSSRWVSDALKRSATKMAKAHADKWIEWRNSRVPNSGLGKYRTSRLEEPESEIIDSWEKGAISEEDVYKWTDDRLPKKLGRNPTDAERVKERDRVYHVLYRRKKKKSKDFFQDTDVSPA